MRARIGHEGGLRIVRAAPDEEATLAVEGCPLSWRLGQHFGPFLRQIARFVFFVQMLTRPRLEHCGPLFGDPGADPLVDRVPILRVLCEGWDKQNLRGKGLGCRAVVSHPSQRTRRMGHPIICGWGKGKRRGYYNSRLPSMARVIVTSSAYSMSLPAGTPVAMRVTRTVAERSRSAR